MSDSFLSSMTFASHEFRESREMGCDCDECGTNSSNNVTRFVSPELLALVRERKRQRLEQRPIQRTQVRVLVQRGPENIAALWHWTLPLGAEPLVEFGSSHRIIWVKRLPNNRMLRSIGKGIIGSRDEELSRIDLSDWTEGGVYFVPSNGGKAVGWIHHTKVNNQDEHGADSEPRGHVELIIGKVPSDKIYDDTSHSWPTWVNLLIQQCRHGLERLPAPETKDGALFYKCDDNDHITRLKDALRQATQPTSTVPEGESASPSTEATTSR